MTLSPKVVSTTSTTWTERRAGKTQGYRRLKLLTSTDGIRRMNLNPPGKKSWASLQGVDVPGPDCSRVEGFRPIREKTTSQHLQKTHARKAM
jgi:hypothetical protein